MKKILVLLLQIFLFKLILAQSGWFEQVITPTPPRLNCVSANVGGGEGWIGGDSGRVIYTSNGGSNWIYRNNSIIGNNNVNVIQVARGDFSHNITGNAFCSANSSTTTYIYRTTNQGINWTIVYQQTGGRIRGIYMVDTMNGYAIGDPVNARWTILKTSNGGLSFDTTGLYLPQNGSELSNYNSVYLATGYNLNLILFGTNSGRLYRSTNFGINWSFSTLPFQNVYSVTLGHYWNGSTQGYSTGYAAGNGAVYTTDYGSTWVTAILPGTGDIHAFYYDLVGSNYACFAKGSLIYSTTNSSLPFTLQYTSPNGGNYTHMSLSVYIFESGDRAGWAVKDNGTVSRYYYFIMGIKKISSKVPDKFSLFQNYPNPFNPATNIKYQISKNSDVKLTVYDFLGNQIALLVNEKLNPGTYEVEFDGSGYASGVYFYKLIATEYTESRRMVLIK